MHTMQLDMYTAKQNAIFRRAFSSDWFLMINHGAVRAGKTVLDNDLFLQELIRVKKNAAQEGIEEPQYILAAYSSSTLQTNILQELTNKYGITFRFDRHNNFKLFGVKIITTFTNSIVGLGAIRGMTSYGAYVNEASLANKQVFDEIIKRCSGLGARVIVDTNPDHPEHWLKKDYIDKADGKRIVANHFTIFDNSFLNQRYIDNVINSTPSGVMTERGIYGRWTIGEGAVYADFDDKVHVISLSDVPWTKIQRYIAGVDWGYEHYGVIGVIAIDDEGVHYLIEEHAKQHTHIDEWVAIAKNIQERYGKNIPFYCDSARPEYVDAFYYAGINAYNANKAKQPGIAHLGKLIKTNQFYVVRECRKFIVEVNQYVWNKTGDEPVKVNDDAMDMTRYAVYSDAQGQYGFKE